MAVYGYFGIRRKPPPEGLFALRRPMLVEREKFRIGSYNKSRGAQAPFLLSEPEFMSHAPSTTLGIAYSTNGTERIKIR